MKLNEKDASVFSEKEQNTFGKLLDRLSDDVCSHHQCLEGDCPFTVFHMGSYAGCALARMLYYVMNCESFKKEIKTNKENEKSELPSFEMYRNEKGRPVVMYDGMNISKGLTNAKIDPITPDFRIKVTLEYFTDDITMSNGKHIQIKKGKKNEDND